jgi:hypothetical protein
MLSKIGQRILSCFGLHSGTVVYPKNPAGKRAIFYKDKKGEHRPVSDYLRSVAGIKQPNNRIAFLMLPVRFREIMDPSLDYKAVRSLPLSFKEEIFADQRAALEEFVRDASVLLSWEGTMIFKRENNSGTFYLGHSESQLDSFIKCFNGVK